MKGRLDWIESVKEYYGKVLSTKSDLQTDVCCAGESPPPHIKEALSLVHEEVKEKFYGCGSPIPLCLDGIVALDLGCGTGRDCFILSKLVGEKGKVIGVDMTEEQLEVARRYVPYHTEAFGYSEPNITFINGYIEDLKGCGLEDSTVDLVISNCVINLSPDKERVFSEIFRVLKPGGELYFSDIFALQRIPENLRRDPLLVGECIGGAMYIEDFRRLLLKVGCADFRIVFQSQIKPKNDELEALVGNIQLISATVRAFKIADLEDRCEDYGQVASYKGTIPESRHKFVLDDHHIFFAKKPMLVCGNTASMLSETRYAPHFEVKGDRSVHYGLFDCSVPVPDSGTVGGCC